MEQAFSDFSCQKFACGANTSEFPLASMEQALTDILESLPENMWKVFLRATKLE
jgi:hypothetical protein